VFWCVKGCEADAFGFMKNLPGAFDGGVDAGVVGDEADAFSFEVLEVGGGEDVDAEADSSGGVERVGEGEEREGGEESATGEHWVKRRLWRFSGKGFVRIY
jgi:hypothetical protein